MGDTRKIWDRGDKSGGYGMVNTEEIREMVKTSYNYSNTTLMACIDEIEYLRAALTAKEGDSVTSNDDLRRLCKEILMSPPDRIYKFNNDDLMEILGGLFKVAALSQMEPRQLGGPRPAPRNYAVNQPFPLGAKIPVDYFGSSMSKLLEDFLDENPDFKAQPLARPVKGPLDD